MSRSTIHALVLVAALFLSGEAQAAYVCVANPNADIKGSGTLVVPVPEDEVPTYQARGFGAASCNTADATPTVIRDRLCQLNAQLPPALGDKLASEFGATPAQMCASATRALQ